VALLTYYWDSAGATPVQLATEAHARVRAFWNSFNSQTLGGCTLVINPVADEIEETTGQIVNQHVGTVGVPPSFAAAGDALPLQTQGMLSLSTSTFVAGRRLKGRQFLPFPLEGSNTSLGTVSPTYTTALNTAAALLSTAVVTPMSQRVWHRPVGGSGGLSAAVSSRAASTQWAVLKSRRT
jgi:hypothetical protein